MAESKAFKETPGIDSVEQSMPQGAPKNAASMPMESGGGGFKESNELPGTDKNKPTMSRMDFQTGAPPTEKSVSKESLIVKELKGGEIF